MGDSGTSSDLYVKSACFDLVLTNQDSNRARLPWGNWSAWVAINLGSAWYLDHDKRDKDDFTEWESCYLNLFKATFPYFSHLQSHNFSQRGGELGNCLLPGAKCSSDVLWRRCPMESWTWWGSKMIYPRKMLVEWVSHKIYSHYIDADFQDLDELSPPW